MSRVKRGKSHLKRRKRILKATKGYRWGRKKLIKRAKTAILKAGVSSFRDRKNKKRNFRQLWQIRINAGVRLFGGSYSTFIDALKKKHIRLDRKILSTLAEQHPEVFKKIFEQAKGA